MSAMQPAPGNPDPLAARISVGAPRGGGLGKAIIALIAALVLGAAGYYGWNWWNEYNGMSFQIRLESAKGLKAGSPVQISGVEAGHLTSVRFGESGADPDRLLPILSVRVRRSFVSALRTNLNAEVSAPLIMGEPVLVIDPGTSEAPPIAPGALIDLAPAQTRSVFDRAAKSLRSFFESEESANVEGREEMRAQLETMLQEIHALEARVERLEEAARAKQRNAPAMP